MAFRFLVALILSPDLFDCAKHLFVAAIGRARGYMAGGFKSASTPENPDSLRSLSGGAAGRRGAVALGPRNWDAPVRWERGRSLLGAGRLRTSAVLCRLKSWQRSWRKRSYAALAVIVERILFARLIAKLRRCRWLSGRPANASLPFGLINRLLGIVAEPP
jgi:hypothetical protein